VNKLRYVKEKKKMQIGQIDKGERQLEP